MPKLGFKLWTRKVTAKTKTFLNNSNLHSRLNTIISFVLACLGIYFAVVANKIGKRSNEIADIQLKMQIADTSQQSQLNKLTQIIDELRTEHQLSDKIYETTGKLNASTELQLQTIKQQMYLAKQVADRANENDTLEQNANMLSLITTFNTLLNFKTSYDAYSMHKSTVNSRSATVARIRELLESQLQNKFVLENAYLKFVWFDFYLFVSNLEFDYSVYDLGTRSVIKDDKQHDEIARLFSNRYLDFLNKMLKPKNAFLKMYSERAHNEYLSSPKFSY